ncbi:MAG: hypothetical protein JXR73_00525 [Candidatus Omnitrophica bacterium]|nr:hypothetical protein [Candidatus Omnitrophota bacterium]
MYIPLYTKIRTESKIFRMCEMLGKNHRDDPDLIRAKVENLWLWMIEHHPDGDLTGVSRSEIARSCNYYGNPDKWKKALMDCGAGGEPGFLEETEDGRLIAHNWGAYGGKITKERARNAARQKRYRNRNAAGNITGNEDSCVTPQIRQDKTRQDKNTPHKPPEGRDELEEEFEQLWQAWPSQRRTSKKEAHKALKSAMKRAAFHDILDAARAYARSPYVQSRLAAGDYGTIKTLPAWLNADRWTEDREAWQCALRQNGGSPAPPSEYEAEPSLIDMCRQVLLSERQNLKSREEAFTLLRQLGLKKEDDMAALIEGIERQTGRPVYTNAACACACSLKKPNPKG